MAFKALVFLALVAVALGFTLPEEQLDGAYAAPQCTYDVDVPLQDNSVLVRVARSPQGSLSANYGYSRDMGSSAGIDYNREIRKNLELYAGGARNFRFNDNSVHAGLRYRF